MALRSIHLWLGWVVVVTNGAVGLWALAAHWLDKARVARQLDRTRRRPLWIATAVAQLLLAAQVVVGVVDMQRRDVDVSGLHLFYGFISLFTVGIVYSYQHQVAKWRYLLYGFGSLFLMGLAIRTMLIPAIE